MLLLVGSIVVLYFEQTPGIRLGLLGVFTLVFAASVGLLTNARRTELFATTAACVSNLQLSLSADLNRYAAVLVVFVSGNFGA